MRTLLPLVALLASLSSAAHAAGPHWPITDMPRFWLLGEGNAHFSADGTFFFSRDNYDALGVASAPSTFQNVKYTDLRFHTGFGFTPNLSAYFQADLRNILTQNSEGSGIEDGSNRGFGDSFVAARWLLYRSKATDRVYPSEWTPNSWLALVEGSWVFPLYDIATGKPPLGDQSNDFTGMLRFAWYINDWMAFSGGGGYTFRTAGYAGVLPWQMRADFMFLQKSRFRFWAQLDAQEALSKTAADASALNPAQVDPIPGGSLLFKSLAPTQRTATLGTGFMISKQWELAVAGHLTATGVNSAKGQGVSVGVAWRPYQMPEIRYEDYRQEQIARLQAEPKSYTSRKVVHFGMQATVLKVSNAGNFLRIAYGRKDGVKVGDVFQVFEPDTFDGKVRTPIAMARVHTSRIDDSFLRVEQRYRKETKILPGFEVRRVIIEE